jgi:hypothetical protein
MRQKGHLVLNTRERKNHAPLFRISSNKYGRGGMALLIRPLKKGKWVKDLYGVLLAAAGFTFSGIGTQHLAAVNNP